MSRWLKRKQLPVWLWAMDLCERKSWTERDIYYWFARRAIRCNSWRFGGET